jgi:hypothetical protein
MSRFGSDASDEGVLPSPFSTSSTWAAAISSTSR